MSGQPPSPVEIEFARHHDREHARICRQAAPRRLRLAFWRDEQLVRNALKAAGEPGLVLDVTCGAGRFWPVLAEHANRVILAADPSPDMLDHARTHHGGALLERVTTFPSSAFTLGLSANAVDCILCLQLFRHVKASEHRLALLREFHRVSRDTVIVSVQIEGRLNIGPAPHRGLADKAEVEAEFRQAGFTLLWYQDFLPGFALTRVYALCKAG
ncbi:class I SAM-dependent methyltransferase [Pseudomonas sp. Fig-3]|jgi:SAM-dependent methyltransferase|uniref:Class I SAM-dependent methyltransferase n=1 Tax=Pseudomonas rhizophila TaxID=2045200 RepID=A0ABM6UEN1_9PSED|nr:MULTISPECIES: class I SAM-dependent methyltransferase [Pseudomonas]AVU75887.1 class I SAM-dependent methyltransferase [Pseudomonas rhizophila]MBD0705585.1 class I SAM-dependent methyltransferase [Pseudomonas sp. PSB1]MDD2031272.1 class I SAM-dependent methyltransferase [Pseudomonas sp. 39167]MDR8387336.1 class I SAM-dependent methyltransferase [Pseudomonas sp. JL2]MEA1031509.1 class I SAM-dependent methyltransferase [Pseudomonas sp. N-137]